jgi:hypothetical protein
VLQASFDDVIHGRSERYMEWLDFVNPVDRKTPAGEASPNGAAAAASQTTAGG